MKVYKATNADMTCHTGSGIFQYALSVPARADRSACGSTGLHACEYILDCTGYYSLGDGNRFFLAEAAGDIHEDGINTRISCTELTLLRELTNHEIAREAMLYMINHPKREHWQRRSHQIDVDSQSAEMSIRDGIAIARGTDPQVRGCAGSHLGLIREDKDGVIREAKLFTVTGPIQPGVWYTLESLAEIF